MSAEGAVPADAARTRALYREMLRIGRFEERCVELYSAGKIRGFLHLYIGEEAVAVGALQAARPEDAVLATYREHGQALARGVPMERVMAEMLGRAAGCSRGRGGSMHLFDAATRFYGRNAIVGGHLPLATGIALSEKRLGTGRVAFCFFGEGAAAEGDFHEALNLAALWRLPVVFCCVGRYGGCYAVTKGLLQEFGPERIRDTPLSESLALRPQLDLDSMDFLRLLVGVRDRTGVDVPEADYPRVGTLDGLVAYVAVRG